MYRREEQKNKFYSSSIYSVKAQNHTLHFPVKWSRGSAIHLHVNLLV
jgi:hypothetical protein